MKTSKRSAIIFLGLLCGLISVIGRAETLSDSFSSPGVNRDWWRLNEEGGRIKIEGGRLVMTAKDESWARTALFSKKGFQFWDATGVTLHVRCAITTTVPTEGRDMGVFIGLTPDGESKTVQATDSISGLSISYSKNKQQAELALVLKEAQGENVRHRGDSRGNYLQYAYPGVKVPVSGDSPGFDLTLHLDATSISGKVAGMDFSQKFPNGLTRKFWENGGYLVIQEMNVAGGRATLAIEHVDIEYTALATAAAVSTRKNPPDQEKYPDRIFVKSQKEIGPDAFSVGGYYNADATGVREAPAQWAEQIRSVGGIIRYPHGLEIAFSFWPYEVKDWLAAFGSKGGNYGTIPGWFYKYNDQANVFGLKKMLEVAKAQGIKVNLQFNCTSIFTNNDFVFVKTLSAERLKRENPLSTGVFDEGVLNAIVANNATLVDYVIAHGYQDTVATWEMDNERWDMPGEEYGLIVARHIAMLRSKLPKAKVIVCLGELSSYSVNPDGVEMVVWSKALLGKLAALGMTNAVDYFAPHLYPYLSDTPEDYIGNCLEDWGIRNVYRSLDTMSAIVDRYGFTRSKFYVSEWGAQSDVAASGNRNDLISCQAAALATMKTAMAIYSHPRVEAATFHSYMHASRVSRAGGKPFSKWGGQTVFFLADSGTYQSTPVVEALKLFKDFTCPSTLLPEAVNLPKGVQCLCVSDAAGKKYFVINSTANSATFPLATVMKRKTLEAKSVTATSVKYGAYGDKPGDVEKIVPREFGDGVIPPYSVNVLR